jgi:hypothetical protein
VVVFSGGEPLLRPEVFEAARLFRARGMTLHLLTSGVLLERFADRVAEHFSRVIVSLDAADAALYERIRGVDALAIVGRGIARLQQIAPEIPVSGRATLHRANFLALPRIIDHAKALGLDRISFLPADVASLGFGRKSVPESAALALDADEIQDFEALIERTIAVYARDFDSGFVAESPGVFAGAALLRGAARRRAVPACPATRRGCRWSWRQTDPCAPVSFTAPSAMSVTRPWEPSSAATCVRSASRSTSAPTRCAYAACAR